MLSGGAGVLTASHAPNSFDDRDVNDFKNWLASGQVLDLGDVYVNPHLLHDSMLSESQITASRAAMYPGYSSQAGEPGLPVSALSQMSAILRAVWKEHPDKKVFVMGGDHSCAWPVSEVLA